MIINCPECSTGFNLPDERITPEGTKLKCSKCEHVFRVREGEDGDPEIFYLPKDNKGGKEGKPKAPKKNSPFPHSGLDLKPKKKSAFGSSDDGEEEAEPQQLADDESEAELTADTGPTTSSPAEDSGPAEGEEPEAAEEDPGEAAEEVAALKTNEGSDFGDPTDHVDPSFGEDGPTFDPKEGKKVPAKKPRGSGPPPGAAAAGPPPTAKKMTAPEIEQGDQSEAENGEPSAESSPSPAVADPPLEWEEEDLAPHRIGGGMATKVASLLLILSLVVMGFFGLVAYLNDGFIDFRAFSDMLDVAFADGEYEPREEWTDSGPATIVMAPEDPVTVESVYGELVTIGGDEQIFVVRGTLRNNESTRIRDVELRAMISTPEGRSLREIAGEAGQDVRIGEFRELSDTDEIRDLLGSGDGIVDPGSAVPFTLVFVDVPQRVIEGERFAFRVEVPNQDALAGTVAAQE